MPSSLTMVLPIALVCSTRLPVSVLVRAPPRSLEVFLGSMGSPASHEASSNVSACCRADLPALRPTRFHGDVQNPARLPFSVAPSSNDGWWYRNVRLLRIGYASRPRLSSRLTLGGLALPRNPWAFGGRVSRPALVTHASILTSMQSTESRLSASARHGKLPYH